ncbi:MAG: hypothetical protein HY337_12100 [Gemmatimonadetes bacterium]|nr:hypothetical protein [Gemmatimonadota bacterium]
MRSLPRWNRRLAGCFILRYVEEPSYDEIARSTNLPVPTVGTYLHRARNELRGMLGPLLDSSPSDSASTPA